jgi:hypothetical protein
MGRPSETGLDSAWRGLHLLIRSSAEMDALVGEVPALARAGVNVILAETNFFYEYTSHPEVREPDSVRRDQVSELVAACRAQGIRLIPQLQCLGHQSWEARTFGLLRSHPEFDETAGQYPGNKGIYCRSWCPRHPGLNALLFDLFDELLEAFEADAFHVGVDEVFIMASEHCPRCRGADPAALLAQALGEYHEHLVGRRGVEMLVWGDRLLDDAVMGYGEWEAARNGTHPAVDRIPKDIIITDWHYEPRPSYPSVPFFQEKGFRVVPCGWRDEKAVQALIDSSGRGATERMLGYVGTTWGSVRAGEMAAWPPLLTAMRLLSGRHGER